jgi:hypothetical protein
MMNFFYIRPNARPRCPIHHHTYCTVHSASRGLGTILLHDRWLPATHDAIWRRRRSPLNIPSIGKDSTIIKCWWSSWNLFISPDSVSVQLHHHADLSYKFVLPGWINHPCAARCYEQEPAEQSIALHCSSIVDHAAGHEEHATNVNYFWVEVHWSGFSLLNWEYTDHPGRFTSCPWITNENSYLEMNGFMSWCEGVYISRSHRWQTLTSESWKTSVLMLREPAGAWGLARFGKQTSFVEPQSGLWKLTRKLTMSWWSPANYSCGVVIVCKLAIRGSLLSPFRLAP